MPKEDEKKPEGKKTEKELEEVAEESLEDETPKSDFDVWFPDIEFIETIHGERINIPPLSADKEAKTYKSIAKLLEILPKKDEDWENFGVADLLKLIPTLLKEAPDDAMFIAATLLDKDDKWVRENLNFDRIFKLIIPFVRGEAELFNKISGLFGRFAGLSL